MNKQEEIQQQPNQQNYNLLSTKYKVRHLKNCAIETYFNFSASKQ